MDIKRFSARLLRPLASQGPIFWIFLSAFVLGLSLLFSSIFCGKPAFSLTDRLSLSIGLLTAAVVWWQGYLITRQMLLSTVVDLYKEWNSSEMLAKRKTAWQDGDPNPDAIEGVLEFLEKVSTLQKNRFVSQQLVWDTFGWYIGRYYFHSKKAIERLRTKWTPKYDPTLYQDLEAFYQELLKFEVEQRNEKMKPGSIPLAFSDIEEEYNQTRKMFIESETRKTSSNE